MAFDDMHVVMYKILAYLYACMKSGEKVNEANIRCDALGINEPYWTSIMVELMERGYVKGLMVRKADNSQTVVPVNPSVTMTGVEFLMENSMMAKAKQFLMDFKATVPGL